MTGGLIQLASYGLHDIFLIGNPQITFFRIVYRKHTNFAMEYLEEQFNGTQNFGNYLSCNLSKAGDLVHRMYLKIQIPQVAINKLQYSYTDPNSISDPYNKFKYNYDQIQIFINKVNYNLVQPLYKLLKISNLKYNDINTKYTISYNRMNYSNVLNNIANINIDFFKTFRLTLTNDNNSNIIYLNNQTPISQYLDFNVYYKKYIKSSSVDISNDLQKLLDNYMMQIRIIKTELVNQLNYFDANHNKIQRQNINFAWVDYLGHQIINRMEIEIGGKVIDYTDPVREHIHFQLTNKILHDLTYNKLIGNINELTNYDSNTKPSYILYIPLHFWFNSFSGLALPLIYLRYHDVKINIKLNDLINCCYYEKLNPDYMLEDLINLESVSLIVNYIYLDTDERKKFAQLSHEYLIEQTQIAEYTNIRTENFNVELPFFNPIEQLFWLIRDKNIIDRLKYFDFSCSYYIDIYEFLPSYENQVLEKNSFSSRNMVKIRTVDQKILNFISIDDEIIIENSVYYNGKYIVKKIDAEYIFIQKDYFLKEEYKFNYDVSILNGKTVYEKNSSYIGNNQAWVKKINNYNPFKTSTLEINGVQRFYKRDYIYHNFVQPYQCNSRSPSYGINTYSFALLPEEFQPSGFCNFSRLDLKTMTFEFDSRYINRTIDKTLTLSIYALGYNILRFAYGKAGVVLNI